MHKGRILSGMRPTGRIHLGNYLGALSNWKKFQEEYDCFYFVADWHALTTDYAAPGEVGDNIKQMVIDWLAVGLDPAKCTMFIQSHVSEHAELHLLLSMITPLGWLQRCPTYKEQLREAKGKYLFTYGFLGYPVLQAADILMYKSTIVPVGEDQLPHLELTREIARRFNHFYGDVFPVPQEKLTQTPKITGIDGRKMSKSYNNCIYLSDSPKVIEKKVKKMLTDPARIHPTDPGHPYICNVHSFLKIFAPESINDINTSCKQGKTRCVDCKRLLAKKLIEELSPFYEKYTELQKQPEFVDKILKTGTQKAKDIAFATMKEVRRVMNI